MNAAWPLVEESARLETLHALRILDTAPDPALDGLVRTAARVANVPMAMVSLVDSGRQWFKARVGMALDETPREIAFCNHAIRQDRTFVVEDALRDERFAGNPLVTGEPHVRFYAGVPLIVDRHAIGTLCVIDRQPRSLAPDVEAILVDLARAVEHWMTSWRANALLRQREHEFRKLAEHLPIVIYRASVTSPHSMIYVSPRVAALGGTPEQWMADPKAKLNAMHPDDRERVEMETAVSLAFDDHVQLEYRLRNADGVWRHYLDLAQVFRPADGEAPYLQGALFDIGDRVSAESAAREASAYWCGLFAQLPDGVLVVDASHRILDANPQASALLGFSTEELRALSLQHLIEGATPEMLAEEARSVFAGHTTIAERAYRHRNGQLVAMEVHASAPVSDRYVKVLRDITRRRAQEAQLRKLSQAVEQCSESICIADLNGDLEYVNAASLATSGYAREELIGRNSRMLQSGATPRTSHEEMWATLKAGKAWNGLLYNRKKSGVEYTERAVITPIQAHDGSVTHYLAVKEDVTEKQQLQAELERHRNHLEELVQRRTIDLQEARRAAESANGAKSAFLAAMSHEIRTPMNGVVGLIDVLRQSSLTPYQCELADTIRESAFALLRIIDDILDFSKIEAGRLALEPEVTDLRHVFEHVCVGLEPMASHRGVALQVFVDPQLPSSVRIDSVRLRQILNNLIGNAIKFSAKLERQGFVHVRATPDDAGQLCIQVTDNGIGIAPEVLERIFHPFVQGESSTTRRYGGTGLGLTICRRLVELFHGSISVANNPSVGATFTVRLPLEVHDASPQAFAHDLSGLECHVALHDQQLTRDWCVYLAAAHAKAWHPQDSAAPDWSSPSPASTTRVVITDAVDELTLPDAAPGYGVVSIEEGNRRNPRLRRPGLVSLDCPVLLQDALLLAVAMAAGRATPVREQWPADLPVIARGAPSIEEAAARHRLVLVAEDNDINQKVILHQLALLGLAAEVVDNGSDALKAWRSGRYALLLTDLHMPGLDGYELTRAIRGEEADGRHIPIIAISATTLRGEAERCLKAGMSDYVSKPVQLDQLARAMARWMDGTPLTTMTPEAQAVPSASASERQPDHERVTPYFDSSVLPRLIGDDPEMLAEFCADYLNSAQRAVAEMQEAVAAGNWRLAGDVAHRLKSSSRSMGMLAVGDHCDALEAAAQTPVPHEIDALMSELLSSLRRAPDVLSTVRNASQEPVTELAEPCVIVVDDEPFQSKVLKRQLNVLGVKAVQVCDGGAEALEWLGGREGSDCLVLLDLNMPQMDGVEFMRHLAERHFTGSLALVSGANERVLESAAKLAAAHELRVIAHLRKPVTPEALASAVERWRSGDAETSAPRARRTRGVAEVRHAIESDQLVVYYQPKVATADGKLLGVEALVRWQHPTDGLLGADAIVEIAEAHGMTDALTRRVLQKALAQLRVWHDMGLRLRVAINISMQNLAQLSFPEFVLGEVLNHGLTPRDIHLEVTESKLLRDVRVPMDILTRLRLKRIGLSIDDFGTGHSSLSQLCNLPFDELKIDRGFVHGSHDHATQRAIFQASLTMAHQLNMTAVAEGVEDRADWDFVRASGCDIAQGYFIARPMPADQLPAWHQEWIQRVGEL